MAEHQVIVFRVGERYVSTQSVDVASGKIVLRSHPATAHTNVELRVGEQIADFPFTDFEGRQRKISEFRGKYVLLDFRHGRIGSTSITSSVFLHPGIRLRYPAVSNSDAQ